MTLRINKIQWVQCFSLFIVLSTISFADVQRYASGLGRDWEFVRPANLRGARLDESRQIRKFLHENFSTMGREAVWLKRKMVSDTTHNHHHFQLSIRGRRVDGLGLAIHYNREGWIEYADSDLEEMISERVLPDSEEIRSSIEKQLVTDFKNQRNLEVVRTKWEPILWRAESGGKWISAYQVDLFTSSNGLPVSLVVEQETAKILSEFQKIRKAQGERVNVNVFKNSIVANATPTAENVTTTDAAKLIDASVHVVREQGAGTQANPYSRKEVKPAQYTPVTSPLSYNHNCVDADETETTTCVNQAFDAGNVFYHLQKFRTQLATYFSSLGVTQSFPDPLFVIINSKFITFGDGADNAAYVSVPCGDGQNEQRCLVFLRPSSSQVTISGCSGAQTINNLAREAFVTVHEYQHFVTDTLSGIEFASHAKTTVGDIIHEGYSDYAAASQISELNSSDITLGLISFPACSGVRRDMGILLPYIDNEDAADPHYAGLSWASAFWKLRTELLKTDTDKLMIKSLSFLGSNPGFVSSVEAVVKADKALFSGVHVSRIREIFYSEVKFLGAAPNPFKNPETLEAYVGLKGCAGVAMGGQGSSSPYTHLLFLIWGIVTLMLGKFLARRVTW